MTKSSKTTSVRTQTVPEGNDGQRLDNYLAGELPGVPRSLIYRVIRTGQVRVNGGRCKPSRRIHAGDQVRIPPVKVAESTEVAVPEWARERVAASLLYENDELLVLDKPSGMAMHSGSGLSWGIIDVLRVLREEDSVELVHRLDRETSGCLVVAKTPLSMRHLQAQFRDNRPEKRYLCLLDGNLEADRVNVDRPLLKIERGGEHFIVVDDRGKPARTDFVVQERSSAGTLAEARLLTGRTHQIRAHAASLGLPLAGDTRYGDDKRVAEWRKKGLDRLFLHAHRLAIDTRQGERLQLSCPLPPELRQVLDSA